MILYVPSMIFKDIITISDEAVFFSLMKDVETCYLQLCCSLFTGGGPGAETFAGASFQGSPQSSCCRTRFWRSSASWDTSCWLYDHEKPGSTGDRLVRGQKCGQGRLVFGTTLLHAGKAPSHQFQKACWLWWLIAVEAVKREGEDTVSAFS